MSARELARQIGVRSDSTVTRWLNGKQEPRISEAMKLADYFGVSLDELVGREPGTAELTPNERQLIRIARQLGEAEAERRLLLLDCVPAQKHGPDEVKRVETIREPMEAPRVRRPKGTG